VCVCVWVGRTFFTGGVEVEAFDEVVHSDASALRRGRPGWWCLCRVRAGCAVRREYDSAGALELSELRNCSWPGIALIDLMVSLLVPGTENVA